MRTEPVNSDEPTKPVNPLICTVPSQALFFHQVSPVGEGSLPLNTTVPAPVTAADAEEANVPLALSVPSTTKPVAAVQVAAESSVTVFPEAT